MATLTIRGLKDETKAALRLRAARHGRSMEAEARAVLDRAVTGDDPAGNLGTQIHELLAGFDGDLDHLIPARSEPARAAPLEEQSHETEAPPA